MEIYFLGYHKNEFLYQLLTIDYSFSNEDNSEGIFLKKMSRLFNDVQVIANEENSIVRIVNIKALKLKWKNLLEKLSVDYQGNAVENYFKTISGVLDNEKEFIKFLEGYSMFGMYFNGHYGNFNLYKKKERYTMQNQISLREQTGISKTEGVISLKQIGFSEEKIISEGVFTYKDNKLNEGYLEINNFDKQTKYSLLWMG